MPEPIKQRVTIQPGGRIDITRSDLPPGRTAEVIVLIDDGGSAPTNGATNHGAPAPRPLSSFLGSWRGMFKSAEDADRYMWELRDEWDR